MTPENLGDYCRQVEQHLTRVNGGHLVRVVGPGFELVRDWAEAGIPLTVVFRGIELKADRHRMGASRRPLRIEFCDADVRETYDSWRRAIGVGPGEGGDEPAPRDADPAATPVGNPVGTDGESSKRPSLSKHLMRAIDRLTRAAGRLDLPEALRDVLGGALTELTGLREVAASARGKAREELAGRLAALDQRFLDAIRGAVPADVMQAVTAAAEVELAAYRGRLAGDAWQKAVDATVDRLLRDRFGLPTIGQL
jgi:hypothetical protein